MQKGVRINEAQLLYLASKAKKDPALSGYMQKKSSDGAARWQTRYFVLYQNLLFYYDNETSQRPSGIALLEGSYCDRIVLPSTLSTTTSSSASAKNRDNDKPVSNLIVTLLLRICWPFVCCINKLVKCFS